MELKFRDDSPDKFRGGPPLNKDEEGKLVLNDKGHDMIIFHILPKGQHRYKRRKEIELRLRLRCCAGQIEPSVANGANYKAINTFDG